MPASSMWIRAAVILVAATLGASPAALAADRPGAPGRPEAGEAQQGAGRPAVQPAIAPLRARGASPHAGAARDTGDVDDARDLLAPLRRPWQSWARAGLTLAALHTLDRPLQGAARDLADGATEESAIDRIADRAEWFGDWESSLPWLVGGSLAVGQLTGGTRGLEEGAALIAGAAAASMANETVNRAVGRGRPAWEEGALSLHPFRGHASFPSGHTAYVFGFASGIDAVTEGWAPAAAAYGVASLTGLSRIYHDRHWLTDVVASAALSTVVSRVATRRALRWLRGGPDDGDGPGANAASGPRDAPARGAARGGLEVAPLVAPRAVGLTVRF